MRRVSEDAGVRGSHLSWASAKSLSQWSPAVGLRPGTGKGIHSWKGDLRQREWAPWSIVWVTWFSLLASREKRLQISLVHQTNTGLWSACSAKGFSSFPFSSFLSVCLCCLSRLSSLETQRASAWEVFTLLMKRVTWLGRLLDLLLHSSSVVLLPVKMESNCSSPSFNARRWQEAGFYLFSPLKWYSWGKRPKSFILTRNFAQPRSNSCVEKPRTSTELSGKNVEK